ncbi:hypothetical protein H009_14698 [Agrobacterium tumefaciens str. Cherry 2E-2-2]|nr:hypothetical protein H009_14698 [Agrobacterium tumefaciens str. Cherry 2E-2-2]
MSTTAPDARITTYTPTVATTEFEALFPIFDNSDLAVYVNGQEQSDFTVSASYVDGVSNNARVIMATGITGKVRIVGDRNPRRQNRFGFGPIQPRDLNLAFDTIQGEMQEARRDIDRSVKSAYGENGPSLPASDTGAFLRWNANGELENSKPSFSVSEDVHGFDTVADAAGAMIPPAVEWLSVAGKLASSDGNGGLYVSSNNGSSDTFTSMDGRTWYRVKDVVLPRLAAEVATRLIEFDIRDSRFAGGAKWDDVNDDSAAFAAAIAYFKTLGGINQYQGKNAARLRLPRGVGRIGTSVDLTGAHNVHIVGEGDGVTTVRLTENVPAFKTTTVAGNDDMRIGLAEFCIYGPGRANVNAHGIDFGALNNGFIRDVRFYALRDAIRLRNNWQTDLTRIKIDGGPTPGGALTCYRGICLLDGLAAGGGSNTVIENAVKIHGGIISGCETVGFRGESVSGSMVVGLEVLACGNTGVLIGDNPGGKPVKWFTWTGGMIDTCGDLLVLVKGASSELTQMHFSSFWLGYANAGSGNGDAVRVEGATYCTFRPDVVFNSDTALVAVGCDEIVYEAGVVQGYDRSSVGSTAIILENTLRSKIAVGRGRKTAGSPGATFLAETGSSDFNLLTDINADGGMTVIGPATVVGPCRPFKAKNHGGIDMPNGQSTVVVTHGLGRTPERGEIQVTPRSTLAASGVNSFAVDTITSTQFTIRTNTTVTATTAFDWFGDVSRG